MKEISKSILYGTPLLKKKRLNIALSYHNFFYDLIKRASHKKEFIVLGLMRSGNHALINWIANQSPGLVSFCNDLEPGSSPKTAVQRQTRLNSFKKVFSDKTLIYSYEDHAPAAVFSSDFLAKKTAFVGKSKSTTAILILRDPYNLFASRLLWNRHAGVWFRERVEYRRHILELWKAHAREFLGDTDYLGEKKLGINYNSWVEEKAYRVHMAETLDLNFSDEGIDKMPEYGGGSSFGEKNTTTERWRRALRSEHRAKYEEIINDEELAKLSIRIFGEELFQNVLFEINSST